MLPIEISFNQDSQLNALNQISTLNNVIDGLFIADLILGFRVTYRDAHTNEEISNPKKIAGNYLQGMFWIDFLSTVPFEWIVGLIRDEEKNNWELMSMLKLARVLRI